MSRSKRSPARATAPTLPLVPAPTIATSDDVPARPLTPVREETQVDRAVKLMNAADEGERSGYIRGALWALKICRDAPDIESATMVVADELKRRYGSERLARERKTQGLET